MDEFGVQVTTFCMVGRAGAEQDGYLVIGTLPQK